MIRKKETKYTEKWYNLSRDFLALYALTIAVVIISMAGLLVLLPIQLARGDHYFTILVIFSAAVFSTGIVFMRRKYRLLDKKIGRHFIFDYGKGIEAINSLLGTMGINYSMDRVYSRWIHTKGYDRYTMQGAGINTVMEIITNRYGYREFQILVRSPLELPAINRLCHELNGILSKPELYDKNF